LICVARIKAQQLTALNKDGFATFIFQSLKVTEIYSLDLQLRALRKLQ
jgi:hypothetical protein